MNGYELTRLLFEHLLTVAGFALALLLAARVLKERRQPGSTIAWLMAIALIPYVGVPLYLLLGGRKMDRFLRMKGLLYTRPGTPPPEHGAPAAAGRVVLASGMPPPRPGNRVALHFSGETAYAALLRLFDQAQESIHVATFILGRDEVGRAVVEALARKAREGVKVRLLLDGLGCLWSGGRFVAPLRAAGGRTARFMPVLPMQRKWSANLRNHRKIVVADHTAAMVGGMNLTTRFMGPSPHRKRFLDSAVFFEGPAVADIEEIFFYDWHYATDEELHRVEVPSRDGRFDPVFDAAGMPQPVTDSLLQVIAAGPDVSHDTFHDALLTAIMEARRRVWLVTPYFVPDESLLKAIALKARSGCDVRVLIPLHSNHPTADLARGPALREITAAGARVYTYPKRMVHTKVLLFDDQLAITGSPNLDMRSIYLNFEAALFHYHPDELAHIAAWFTRMQHVSRRLRPESVSPSREWAENFCRLISPLL